MLDKLTFTTIPLICIEIDIDAMEQCLTGVNPEEWVHCSEDTKQYIYKSLELFKQDILAPEKYFELPLISDSVKNVAQLKKSYPLNEEIAFFYDTLQWTVDYLQKQDRIV